MLPSPFVRASLLLTVLVISVIIVMSTIFRPPSLWAISPSQVAPDAVELLIPLSGIVQVAAGDFHTCALTTQGAVLCWGSNASGQLGINSNAARRLMPVEVIDLEQGVIAIAAGSAHTCALLATGGVQCWGDNTAGQVGDNTQGIARRKPVAVFGLSNGVLALEAGHSHTCALLATGVVCWGKNDHGQIGNGVKGTNRLVPTSVSGLSDDIAAIAAGGSHTCALRDNGGVLCWGNNDYGQVGDGTEDSDRLLPVAVSSLSNIAAIAAGGKHTCALGNAGAVACWGDNSLAAIGNGYLSGVVLEPAGVYGLEHSVTAVALGANHSCAVIADGGMKCWGRNDFGQNGLGTVDSPQVLAIDVIELGGPVVSITASEYNSCAISRSGGVKCWGRNHHGQVGNNTLVGRIIPGDVLVPATCFALTLSHSGNGADPVATPNQSPVCPPAHYLPGTAIALVSAPGTDRYVQNWVGTQTNQSRDPSNLVIMPAADHVASVSYATCRKLTRSHTGNGVDPVAAPGQSMGCALGKFAANDVLTLVAAPDDDHRVQSWTGATQSPSAGDLVNTLTMADADTSVAVTYEPCLMLTTSIQGQGELLQATPSATFGCDPSSYVHGQSVTLSALPATGWRVARWHGTTNDASTATTNSVIMNLPGVVAGVIYEEIVTTPVPTPTSDPDPQPTPTATTDPEPTTTATPDPDPVQLHLYVPSVKGAE